MSRSVKLHLCKNCVVGGCHLEKWWMELHYSLKVFLKEAWGIASAIISASWNDPLNEWQKHTKEKAFCIFLPVLWSRLTVFYCNTLPHASGQREWSTFQLTHGDKAAEQGAAWRAASSPGEGYLRGSALPCWTPLAVCPAALYLFPFLSFPLFTVGL